MESRLPRLLEEAVPKRRLQFLAGRHCARVAVRQLVPEAMACEIGRDEDGRPVWPQGLVGSITHTEGFAAAAVARRADAEAVGIDSEALLTRDVAREIAGLVTLEGECDRIIADGACGFEASVTLIFSAKEALFKCLNPIVRRFFDYRAAELVDADTAAGRFTVAMVAPLDDRFRRGERFTGSFRFHDGHVHTAMVLPR